MPTEQHFEIACSPEAAFEGFTDAAKIIGWWGDPNVYETVSWAADLCEGGKWRADFQAPDGARFGAGGVYLLVNGPSQLEWTWMADWEPGVEMTIQMRFAPLVIGTKLTIETKGHRSVEACSADEAAWKMIVGWFSRRVGKTDE